MGAALVRSLEEYAAALLDAADASDRIQAEAGEGE